MVKYYIVTEEVKNPVHDKRCKYGYRAMPTFPVGTIIEALMSEHEIAGITINRAYYHIKNEPLNCEVFSKLPVEERELTPKEYYLIHYGSYQSRGLICHLLDSGKLSINDVNAYYESED
jgi:hypothetical protein